MPCGAECSGHGDADHRRVVRIVCRRREVWGPPGRPAVCVLSAAGQLVVTAVSSTTKLVWSEESSTPENFRATVVPAKADRLKDFWT
ncbi:hypothetical protein OK074_0324 [Actinobacteria bacterium OK074]|nr:hypothetical protein OK074_0324 [Actinobacteria bacterium OK074]